MLFISLVKVRYIPHAARITLSMRSGANGFAARRADGPLRKQARCGMVDSRAQVMPVTC